MFSAQISRTVKGDAISEIAKSILRTKVLSLLEANKTNKEFLVDTRNAISFILHNQNLKIRNLNLLDSDKINRLSSVLFTPNFIMDGAIDTITSVAKSISENKWQFISKALNALKESNHFRPEKGIAESIEILLKNSNLIDYCDIDSLYEYSKNF